MKTLLRFFGLLPAADPEGPAYVPPAGAKTTIGPDVTFKGELTGVGTLVILGRFEGDIGLDGTLHVGPDARVDANITADAIVVAGLVRGNLAADTRVEILSGGSLTGSVKSGSFAAADGASVKGEVWVERVAAAVEEPA